MPVKKRNPQDTTFRNINALKRRVDRLEVAVVKLIKLIGEINGRKSKTRKK